MKVRIFVTVFSALLAVAGCSAAAATSSPKVSAQATKKEASTNVPSSFINRIWVVAESRQVASGELYGFLSDGTLVMASPHGTPSLGSWRYLDGHLTMNEGGLQYKVDILELNKDTFRIRIHSPGEPIDIRFKPAVPPLVLDHSVNQPVGR
jgi:hypothetical protein